MHLPAEEKLVENAQISKTGLDADLDAKANGSNKENDKSEHPIPLHTGFETTT